MTKQLHLSNREQSLLCNRLALLVSSGVPILDSLKVIAGSFGVHSQLGEAILFVRSKVAEGRCISDPMREAGFSQNLCDLVEVGEATSALDVCLKNYAEVLRSESSVELKKFAELLGLFVDCGLPLVQSLELTAKQFCGSFADQIRLVIEKVKGGTPFYKALEKEGFDELFCTLVAAGETGGILDTILKRYAEIEE